MRRVLETARGEGGGEGKEETEGTVERGESGSSGSSKQSATAASTCGTEFPLRWILRTCPSAARNGAGSSARLLAGLESGEGYGLGADRGVVRSEAASPTGGRAASLTPRPGPRGRPAPAGAGAGGPPARERAPRTGGDAGARNPARPGPPGGPRARAEEAGTGSRGGARASSPSGTRGPSADEFAPPPGGSKCGGAAMPKTCRRLTRAQKVERPAPREQCQSTAAR